MGSSGGITRGQLRPHFSGRSPPFLLAALCVGLGILGVSYWSLSQQYNQLEEQLKKTLIRKDSIENDLNFIQNQLSAREDEFSRAKQTIQKNEQDLSSANVDVKTKTDEINAIHSQLKTARDNYVRLNYAIASSDCLFNLQDNCQQELVTKTNQLADAMTKLKDNEQQRQDVNQMKELDDLKAQNLRLEQQLEQLRQQLGLKNRSDTNSVADGNKKYDLKVNVNSNQVKNNVSQSIESPSLANQLDVNPVDNPKVINQLEPINPINPEPIKANSLSQTNGLAEEDRKEEALVEANMINSDNNDNEVADDLKQDNKEAEESKAKQIQI